MKLLEIKISVSIFAVVQSLSQVWLCNPMDCSMPGFPVYQHLLEFAQTHVHWVGSLMPSNHLILCCPLLLLHSSLSQHLGLFQWVFHIRWPRYWSFSFSTSPTNEQSGLISFRIDWFDCLAVQRTLKSLQHHNSKASIHQHSAFFIVQLYWKNHSFHYTDLCQKSDAFKYVV